MKLFKDDTIKIEKEGYKDSFIFKVYELKNGFWGSGKAYGKTRASSFEEAYKEFEKDSEWLKENDNLATIQIY